MTKFYFSEVVREAPSSAQRKNLSSPLSVESDDKHVFAKGGRDETFSMCRLKSWHQFVAASSPIIDSRIGNAQAKATLGLCTSVIAAGVSPLLEQE